MMLQMALSQSQYFSAKLSKDVKRGLHTKIDMGIRLTRHHRVGSMTTSVLWEWKTITVDKKRFPVLRKCWDLMLLGKHYTAKDLRG